MLSTIIENEEIQKSLHQINFEIDTTDGRPYGDIIINMTDYNLDKLCDINLGKLIRNVFYFCEDDDYNRYPDTDAPLMDSSNIQAFKRVAGLLRVYADTLDNVLDNVNGDDNLYKQRLKLNKG